MAMLLFLMLAARTRWASATPSWPHGSCDPLRQGHRSRLVKRGLSESDASALDGLGVDAVGELLASIPGAEGVKHAFFSGDSLMGQLFQVVVCTARTRFGCALGTDDGIVVHLNDTTSVYPEIGHDRTWAVANNASGFLVHTTLTCPFFDNDEATTIIEASYLKWYKLRDGSQIHQPIDPSIGMTTTAHRNVLTGSSYAASANAAVASWWQKWRTNPITAFIANSGHAGLMGPVDALQNTTLALLDLAADLPNEPVTVLLGHMPQHFAEYAGTFPDYKNASERSCACQQVTDLQNQLSRVQNVATERLLRAYVTRMTDVDDDCRWARYGLAHRFWTPLAREACSFHFADADCTHYLPAVGLFAPLLNELASTIRESSTTFRYCRLLGVDAGSLARFSAPSTPPEHRRRT